MKPARRYGLCLRTTLLLTAMAAPAAALAALGGGVDSIEVDRAALKGQLSSTAMAQYDVHQITSDVGAVVHEYTTPGGQVFAVTWQGPTRPDLQQLLGSYFGAFKSAAEAAHPRPGNHRALTVQQSDLVVQSVGRLRAFHGLAYVPSLVPAGVAVSELP